MERHKTVGDVLDMIKDEQRVLIFNEKHNLCYIGQAGFAPLMYCRIEFTSFAISKYNEIVING